MIDECRLPNAGLFLLFINHQLAFINAFHLCPSVSICGDQPPQNAHDTSTGRVLIGPWPISFKLGNDGCR
jgi:uncharacterized membrane protein